MPWLEEVAKSLLEDKRNETTLNARYTEVDVGKIGDPRRVPGHIWKNGRLSESNSMGVHSTMMVQIRITARAVP